MHWLKTNLGYSANEIKLIQYGLSAIVMELSKFIIMMLFFLLIGKPLEYLFGTFILLLLRTQTGGLHFTSYTACLFFSAATLYFGCVFLPDTFQTSNTTMLTLLLGCIIITYFTGPVVSKTRPIPNAAQAKKGKIQAFKIIFFYFIAVFLFSENHLISIGFWIIVLQTVQLLIAYFLRKENSKV